MVHRTLNFQFFSGEAPAAEAAYGYTIQTPDGGVHQLHGVAGTEDINGEPTQFDSVDVSGYHLALSMPDSEGVLDHVTVTDRSGNLYQGDFVLIATKSSCPRPAQTTLSAPGNHPPYTEDAPMGDIYCPETANASLITDSNGNQVSISAPPTQNPTMDTLGRGSPFGAGGASDASGCIGTHPFFEALDYIYQDPDNITRTIKFCYAEVTIQTAFNQPNPHDPSSIVAEAVTGATLHYYPVTTVVLGDGTHWTFDYDSYGELDYIGLPSGGSISYSWETIPFDGCDALNDT
jgi:YD repeat-containing protein